MKELDEIFNDLMKIEMLQREVDELVSALKVYADQTNWHNHYVLENSPSGEGFKNAFARQENGWEIAQRALGDF